MKKLTKGIAVALMVLGFLFMLCAVGSAECGEMESYELVDRAIIGFGGILGGGYLINKLEEKEEC